MCVGSYGQFSTVPTEAKRGPWILWSWSYRRYWAGQHGCWEQNSGPLPEQVTLLTSSWSTSPTPMVTIFLVVLYMCIYVSIGYMCADVHRSQKRYQGLWRWHSPPDMGGGNQTPIFLKNRKWWALSCTTVIILQAPLNTDSGRGKSEHWLKTQQVEGVFWRADTSAQRHTWCCSTHHHHHLGNISS